MPKFRILTSVLAVVVAILAAYSFTTPKLSAASSDDVKLSSYWIKYDCKSTPGVTIVSSGNNYTPGSDPSVLQGYSPNCPGSQSACARLFPAASVQDHPTSPGNKIPISGLENTYTDQRQCQSIVP